MTTYILFSFLFFSISFAFILYQIFVLRAQFIAWTDFIVYADTHIYIAIRQNQQLDSVSITWHALIVDLSKH